MTETYGVIAAQRQPGGQVHLVVAGINKPATSASAEMVKLIEAELPYGRNLTQSSQRNPVLWAVVRVPISTNESTGDNREIGKPRFLFPPKVLGDESVK
ncbi:MAG: hypothetical protein GYA63_10560 [Armatimonadetes bacterium]|nr:hypothetical protein [Armatimonadota bacterium]